jgi:hypothetical protein
MRDVAWLRYCITLWYCLFDGETAEVKGKAAEILNPGLL